MGNPLKVLLESQYEMVGNNNDAITIQKYDCEECGKCVKFIVLWCSAAKVSACVKCNNCGKELNVGYFTA